MKILWLIGFVIGFVVIAVALSGCAEPDSESQSTTVNGNHVYMKGFAYDPATITVSNGTTVTWTQQDSAAHTVTSVSGNVLDSQNFSTSLIFPL